MTIEWNQQEPNYADQMQDDIYHVMRTNFIRRLLPEFANTVIDFGSGEGAFTNLLIEKSLAKKVYAIDPSPVLTEVARKNASLTNNPNVSIIQGDVHELKKFENSSIDLIIALNVLAYMSTDEEKVFYEESNRILAKNGHLLVTHSNELFDLFTLNNLTIDFFQKNFKVDVKELIDIKGIQKIETYKIRENPLSYARKLLNMGFQQIRLDFFHYHCNLPRNEDSPARNKIIPQHEERSVNSDFDWTNFFQSSTFGVLARKVD